MDHDLREQAAVLALTRASPRDWHRTAALITEAGSALALINGESMPLIEELQQRADELLARLQPGDLERASTVIEGASKKGLRLLTVLDHDYPTNLQLIFNRPPFIWVRGTLQPADSRAIAIVGTRQASPAGLQRAQRLSAGLAAEGVTVLSGLARGIDTAAHSAALSAGGRTVAVIGNGLLRPTYPPENAELAEQISMSGAVVSQFWPDSPPQRFHFPMRNIVMSGLALGTVVVEASHTSGAKMQARFALEHGKRLFLLESLVNSQDWARRYAERPGVTIVRELDDILDVLVKIAYEPQQLTLQF